MRIHPTPEDMAALTPLWTGERFDDGRPRVPDEVLADLRFATTEQAWGTMLHAGYPWQFAGAPWQQTHPGTILVGRAVTAQFVPTRPDLDQVVVAAGAAEGHLEGDRQNSWVIQSLVEDDVMVVDIFGKVVEGTVVGDNLGTAVAARTKRGAVIHGGVRDLQGLHELEGVNFYYRGADPTPIRHVALLGINIPVRIDTATVMPGDVVLGTPTGVSFIPAHLAAEVARQAIETRSRDVFGKLRLTERTYTSAEIDVPAWAEHIEADYVAWKAAQAALDQQS